MAAAGGLHPFGVLVLLAGAFLPIADFFIVNVALPTIDRTMNASAPTLELIVAGSGIGYVRIVAIGSETAAQVKSRIAELTKGGAAKLIVDVRRTSIVAPRPWLRARTHSARRRVCRCAAGHGDGCGAQIDHLPGSRGPRDRLAAHWRS